MDDTSFPFPASGASDDETKRHNNLRRDILTSLLEVDQSIKGLEHSLGGKIQQIEDRLPQPEERQTGAEAAPRCDFDPAATTAWALRILQENLAPITAGLAALQSSMRSLEGKEGPESLLETLRREVSPLREALPGIKEEAGRIHADLLELKDSSPGLQESCSATLDATSGIAARLSALQDSLSALEGRSARSQEAMAPLGEDLARLKESLLELRDGVTPLRDVMEESARQVARESRPDLGPVHEALHSLADSTRLIQETLAGMKEMIAPIQESSLRAAETSRASSDAVASLQKELLSVRHAFDESRGGIPRLEVELQKVRESSSSVEDRLTGLREAILPLRDLASQTAAAAQSGATGLVALREETRAIPGALRVAREELESSLHKQGDTHSELLRDIGGKVLEEISLVLTEMRRAAAQAPETLTVLSREVAEVRQAQKEAAKGFSKLRDLLEQNPSAELTLSAIQQIQQQNDASAAGLSRLEEIVRGGDEALKQMRESHGKVVKAFEGYHQAARAEEVRIRRRSAQEHNNRGVILYYRGALEPAEASFRKALEVEPGYAEAWNNLGLALSRQGKADDAAAAFQKAIEIDPEMGEVYNNLGFLYHTSLQYDRALEMFNRALQSSSDSAVAYTNLGNTYYKLSRHEQAVGAWKRALELDPLNENARRCLRMYQQENA